MSALLEIWHSIQGILTHADWITLALIALVVIIGGFAIQGLNSILGATVLGLIGFVLLVFVRAITIGKQDFTAYANTGWHDILGLQMMTLLSYFVIFAVLIGIVHVIRSAVFR